jgi:iron complex outermembrane receptor protein
VISDGYQLERLPKHSVQVLLGYRTTLANNMDFFANFDLFYQSKRFVDSTEQRYFDGYWDSDARIGVETEKWSALAYVSNVFEDDTVRGGTGTGDFHPFGSAAFALNAAPKRQYGVRLDYNF